MKACQTQIHSRLGRVLLGKICSEDVAILKQDLVPVSPCTFWFCCGTRWTLRRPAPNKRHECPYSNGNIKPKLLEPESENSILWVHVCMLLVLQTPASYRQAPQASRQMKMDARAVCARPSSFRFAACGASRARDRLAVLRSWVL